MGFLPGNSWVHGVAISKGEKENCSYGGVLCDFHLLLVLGGVVSVSLRKKSDGVDLTV